MVFSSFVLLRQFRIFPRLPTGLTPPYSPQEGDRWEFSANRQGGGASARSFSDILQGEFAVVYENGKPIYLQIINGKEFQAPVNTAKELERLFSFTQNDRNYFKFPLFAGAKWP